MCVRAHARTTGMGCWRSVIGTRGFTVNETEGHLSSTERSSQGVGAKGERKGGRRLWGSSLHHSRCLLFPLSTSWQLTTRWTPLQPRFGWSLSQTTPFTGPPETFVPFISTTNTYRCSEKEEAKRQRVSKHMLPPVNDCWFGDNLLLCKQTTCWRAQARSGFIMQCKHGQLSV